LSLFNSNGTLLLLHNGLKEVKKSSKYDLVLSPQFYIVKREKLPVKYAFQAKKLAPSIMEDLLPNNAFGYEYVAQKDNDSWLFFAYRPKEIENFLKGCCQVRASKIGNIYFADQLKNVLKKVPIGIDEHKAITLVDDFATIVPRKMLGEDRYAKFSNKLRPKEAYKFKPSSKAKTDSKASKSAIVVASLLALLGLAFLIEGYSYKRAANSKLSANSELLSSYPQLQSKLTRDSIKAKYSKIEKRERSIRENIDLFSQLSSKKTLLSRLFINGNKLVATFDTDRNELKKIKHIIATTNLKIAKESANSITVEGALK